MQQNAPECYTNFRLNHATPEHLHVTSRSIFIGPVPDGWLEAHKSRWKKLRTNYHRECSSFVTSGPQLHDQPGTEQRRESLRRSIEVNKATTMTDVIGTSPLNSNEGPLKASMEQHPTRLPMEAAALFPGTENFAAVTKDFQSSTGSGQSSRPPLSILVDKCTFTNHESRQASALSAASFATAPETLEEQAEIIRRERDEEDENDDDDSTIRDEETVRGSSSPIPRMPETSSPQPSVFGLKSHSLNETASDEINPKTPSSEGSMRSLVRKFSSARPYRYSDPRHNKPGNLVHFNTDNTLNMLPHNGIICPEGHAIEGRVHRTGLPKRERMPFRRSKTQGELLRAERMLLRIETARDSSLPEHYDETKSLSIERKTIGAWREYVVVARATGDGMVVLNFHKNRTIPAIQLSHVAKHIAEFIVLEPKVVKANFYSNLDKTIVLSQPHRRGTIIFILRPRTITSSIEWYAFIQTCLGIAPGPIAIVNVPGLNLKLRLELDIPQASTDSSNEYDAGVAVINDSGQIVSSGGTEITVDYIIDACWDILYKTPDFREVLQRWGGRGRMGLCWRRYDRIEWIHGFNAKRLVGQWAMATSHELEFRPKEHYPTTCRLTSGQTLEEPPPIEGFLIRLTSSEGRQARFGKVFYKRLYFSTHDSLLFFAKPARATPPPPPQHRPEQEISLQMQRLNGCPLIYEVNPYPVRAGEVDWLQPDIDPTEVDIRDLVATAEAARRVQQLQTSDGFIDLTQVVRIRKCIKGQTNESGLSAYPPTSVDFQQTGISSSMDSDEEGVVDDFDDGRTFELVMSSGLYIRLQAYNRYTRTEWMKRLNELVLYWKHRTAEDHINLRLMRQANIDTLRIDEEIESVVGIYAKKWEVSQCTSEPRIYNFCPISSCRTIAVRCHLFAN